KLPASASSATTTASCPSNGSCAVQPSATATRPTSAGAIVASRCHMPFSSRDCNSSTPATTAANVLGAQASSDANASIEPTPSTASTVRNAVRYSSARLARSSTSLLGSGSRFSWNSSGVSGTGSGARPASQAANDGAIRVEISMITVITAPSCAPSSPISTEIVVPPVSNTPATATARNHGRETPIAACARVPATARATANASTPGAVSQVVTVADPAGMARPARPAATIATTPSVVATAVASTNFAITTPAMSSRTPATPAEMAIAVPVPVNVVT